MNDLNHHLERAAGPVDGSLDLAELHRRVRRLRRRRRAVAASAAGILAFGAFGIAAMATGGGPAPQHVAAGEGGDTTTVPASSTSTVPAPTSTVATTSTSITAPVTATTATPATTTTVLPAVDGGTPSSSRTVVGLSGTYVGVSPPYAVGGRCQQLTHEYDATLTLLDGSTWRLREDSCGRVEGGHWWGQGTFTITRPDGATLTGTFDTDVDLPTTGAPYTLEITGGTGALDGAEGQCSLDNHMRDLEGGDVEQSGPFTCTYEIPTYPLR
ncbi:hypothetical protein BH10ACT1_BH10ACT1_15160 [soil metagenome]